MHLRHLEAHDYAPIIAVINDWWGGRQMADMLPKLFFVHFRDTSFAIDQGGQGGAPIAFLAGFISQTDPAQAYIHFVGIDPAHRRRGLGRMLYERFFAAAHTRGCTSVHCVTAPVNTTSIAFHTRMGFTIEHANGQRNGTPCTLDYDGRGQDRVQLVKALGDDLCYNARQFTDS